MPKVDNVGQEIAGSVTPSHFTAVRSRIHAQVSPSSRILIDHTTKMADDAFVRAYAKQLQLIGQQIAESLSESLKESSPDETKSRSRRFSDSDQYVLAENEEPYLPSPFVEDVIEARKLRHSSYWDCEYSLCAIDSSSHEWFRSFEDLWPWMAKYIINRLPSEADPQILHLGCGDSV